ncbi:MAG: hypothetical protein IPG50_11920 [Myxococcales bacterium]|nr:hypothetical protein [Myxococcales bacterium]
MGTTHRWSGPSSVLPQGIASRGVVERSPRALVVEETRSPLRDARRDASVVDEGELGAPPHRVARPVVDASASIDAPIDTPIDTASDASLETPSEPLESRSLPRSTPPPPTIGVDTRALSSAPPPPLDSVSIALNAANASSATRAASGTGGVPLASVERFIDEGRWDVLSDMLEASARAGELPPHLMMVYAVARAEAHPEDAGLVALAIKASADAYGVPEASPIACLLAKRTLRRTPREWGKRPAPRGTISTIIVFVALVLGGGGGFWLSTTRCRSRSRVLALEVAPASRAWPLPRHGARALRQEPLPRRRSSFVLPSSMWALPLLSTMKKCPDR